jgi:hypothetical protein
LHILKCLRARCTCDERKDEKTGQRHDDFSYRIAGCAGDVFIRGFH